MAFLVVHIVEPRPRSVAGVERRRGVHPGPLGVPSLTGGARHAGAVRLPPDRHHGSLHKLLPPGAWLSIHRLSLAVFGLAWLHGILAGTDSADPAGVYVVTGLAVVAAGAYRYWAAAKGGRHSRHRVRRSPDDQPRTPVRRTLTVVGVVAVPPGWGLGTIQAASAWTADAPLAPRPSPRHPSESSWPRNRRARRTCRVSSDISMSADAVGGARGRPGRIDADAPREGPRARPRGREEEATATPSAIKAAAAPGGRGDRADDHDRRALDEQSRRRWRRR